MTRFLKKSVIICALLTALTITSMPLGADVDVVFAKTDATLVDGENSDNENFAIGDISSNLRDAYDNGMSYSDGVYSMQYSGGWLHSLTIVQNDLTATGKVFLNGVETETKELDVYYSCKLKWTFVDSSRRSGMVLGKLALPETGEEVYVSFDLAPVEKQLVVYFYKKIGGEADAAYIIQLTDDFQINTTYTLSALKTGSGIYFYLKNGETVVAERGPFTVIQCSDLNAKAYEIDLREIVPVAGVHFLDIEGTVSDLTAKFVNEGVYTAQLPGREELNYAREYLSDNIFDLSLVKASVNQRNAELNGFKFERSVASMQYRGDWLRAVNYFKSDYLSSTVFIKDGEEISTKNADVYYKAKYTVSETDSFRTLGLIIGKTTVLQQTVYVSCNVTPENGLITMYFCTSNPYDFSYEVPCSVKTQLNKEYLFEIVRLNGKLHVYIDGKQCFETEGYHVTAYGNDSIGADIDIADLTPCFGTNFMDIGAQISDFEMKYLTEYDDLYHFIEPDYPDDTKVYVYNTEKIETSVGTDQSSSSPTNKNIALPIILYVVGGVSVVGSIAILFIFIIKRRKK